MESKDLIGNKRKSNTIKFCFAILSIICGIFLILMLFYQYLNLLKIQLINGVNIEEDIMFSAFHPELFYPEIFIPQGVILVILGFVLLFILRWQVRNENENKRINTLSIWLIIPILIFIGIFMGGLILGYYFLGKYGIISPLSGMITAIIVVSCSIYILVYVNKTKRNKSEGFVGNKKPPTRLLTNNVLNYLVITIFLFHIFIFSFIPMFFEPGTVLVYDWEDGPWTTKVALPGMNVSYNLTLGSQDGPATFIFLISDNDIRGNWSVSSKEITVKPNEKKIITFINYVPEDVPEGYYYYGFYLIYMTNHGPGGGWGVNIVTEVTHNISYYNESQSIPDGFSLAETGGFATKEGFYEVMIRLSTIILLAWIVITVFFLWNKRMANAGDI